MSTATFSTQPRIGFIGAGRLGKALAWSLAQAGASVVAVASQFVHHAEELAAPIPGCTVLSPQDVVDRSDLVFITTPDEAISATAEALRWRAGMGVVHCSGVTEVGALNSAARAGAAVGGFHPMQTFGDPHAAVASLPGCTITLEAHEPLDACLVQLAQQLGCRVNRLPPGMRGRYHAAAGFTSQFINALFAQAVQVWASWGASEDDALHALLPLAHGTLASMTSAGIAKGMPGPVSRGDLDSVEKHVDALTPLGEGMLDFYRLLCDRTVPIAQHADNIDADTAAKFRRLLQT